MFSNYVKTMKNSGLRATPALVAYRPALPIKNKKLNLNSPKGLHIKAQGCGTPLPWVGGQQSLYPTLEGLRNAGLRNPFRVGCRL